MPRIPGASSCRAAAVWGTCSRIWTRPCWTRRCSNGWWTSCRTGMTSGPHGKRRRPPRTRPRSRASVRGRPSLRPCTATIPSTRRRPCCPVWDSTRASGTCRSSSCPAAGASVQSWPGCWSPGPTSCCSTNRPTTSTSRRWNGWKISSWITMGRWSSWPTTACSWTGLGRTCCTSAARNLFSARRRSASSWNCRKSLRSRGNARPSA